MVCRECGCQIPDDSVTCPECGSVLSGEEEAVSSETNDDTEIVPRIKAFDIVDTGDTAPDGGKTGKRRALIIPVIAAALVLLFLCYYNLPQNRYERLMKRAEEHLSRYETVLAAAEYRKALRLMPDSQEAQDALYSIWSEILDEVMSLADGGCFDAALVKARILPQIDPDRSTMNRSAVTVIYKQWVRFLAETGDSGGISRLLSDAAEDLTEDEIAQLRQEAADAEDYFRIVDMLNEEAEKIISLSDEGNTEEVFTEIAVLSGLADRYMDLGGNAPFVFGTDGAEKELGYFFSGFDVSVVIGKLDLFGIAEGEATAYYAERFGMEGQYLYWYTCEWKNGRPNGYCEYYETEGFESEEPVCVTMKGMLSDGDWDGEVEETYTDGETYSIKYDKGHVEVLLIEDTDRNIVGYNKDGSKKRYYSDQAVGYEYGVPYMYYN